MKKLLEAHKFADLLAPMSKPEYDALKADIDANGQRDPIILFEGKILDGRNRYRAMQELGKKPVTVVFEGGVLDAESLVMSKSIRRNLTASQRAGVAVNFKERFQRDAAARKAANGGNKKADPSTITGPGEKGEWRDVAGKTFGVSGSLVSTLDWVRTEDRREFDKVLKGESTVNQAHRIVKAKMKKKEMAAKAKLSPTTGDADIITGECVPAMDEIPANKIRLIFADPPYNIGVDYNKRGKKKDLLTPEEYLANTRAWMEQAERVLTDDGALWVMICDEWAIEYGTILKEIGFEIRAWIKWYETFGQNMADNFNRTSRHIFYCIKAGNDAPVFHRDAFTRDSDRKAKYGDKRAAIGGKIWDDVWTHIPRLVENAAERIREFPTQLPLALVKPIILGCSDPGDTVFDPFTGSGTTAVAAVTTGRRFVGTEKEKPYADIARVRVRAAIAGMVKMTG